ncbi:hypothetical protein CCP4SC76_7810004 [Gammaproteobacteria bacterium]
MHRGSSGRYEITTTVGEAVRAFVPAPLPPLPPLDLSGSRQRLLEQANLACGRLDGVSALLPYPELFIYGYVRREAVLSSQIEGTQSYSFMTRLRRYLHWSAPLLRMSSLKRSIRFSTATVAWGDC